MKHCPCGYPKTYADCCGRFISHNALPNTPEELMRSRYTAYTQANIDYIIETMKPPASVNFNPKEAKQWAQKVKWLKLEVLHTSINDTQGFVEFIASFDHAHKKQSIHEHSEFRRDHGRWYYINRITQL